MADRTKEELLYLARLAEQCDRFDEMVDYVCNFSKMGEEEKFLSIYDFIWPETVYPKFILLAKNFGTSTLC